MLRSIEFHLVCIDECVTVSIGLGFAAGQCNGTGVTGTDYDREVEIKGPFTRDFICIERTCIGLIARFVYASDFNLEARDAILFNWFPCACHEVGFIGWILGCGSSIVVGEFVTVNDYCTVCIQIAEECAVDRCRKVTGLFVKANKLIGLGIRCRCFILCFRLSGFGTCIRCRLVIGSRGCAAAAGNKRKHHNCSQNECNDFFHVFPPDVYFDKVLCSINAAAV